MRYRYTYSKKCVYMSLCPAYSLISLTNAARDARVAVSRVRPHLLKTYFADGKMTTLKRLSGERLIYYGGP